jgi:hypothetical protein
MKHPRFLVDMRHPFRFRRGKPRNLNEKRMCSTSVGNAVKRLEESAYAGDQDGDRSLQVTE